MVRLIDIRILIRVIDNKQIMMGVQRKFPFFGEPPVYPITLDEARGTVEALKCAIDLIEKNSK